MLILSEYKGEFQHRFQSKCYRFIFLDLPTKENKEVIPFIFIPELRQSNVPLVDRSLHLSDAGVDIVMLAVF